MATETFNSQLPANPPQSPFLCIPSLAPSALVISGTEQIFDELKMYTRDLTKDLNLEVKRFSEASPPGHVFISNSFDGYIFLDSLLLN